MQTRKPVVAGQFYPSQHDTCLDEINDCLKQRTLKETLPETIVAGIVPHAGWTFSGSLAALVFSAIKQQHEKVDTFVIFGAAHSYLGLVPVVYDKGSWDTPLGEVFIDEDLAETVLKKGKAKSDSDQHCYEHSIEVQLPFIRHLFPDAGILPVLVPPSPGAISLGRELGEIISPSEKKIVCIGSTDLTHYGSHYGFEPMGPGKQGFKWASEVNDKEFIDAALKLDAETMLKTSEENHNACGAGAAAAAVATAEKLGKTQGILLAHTNSNEIMLNKMGTSSSDSVGYAAIVF